MLTSDGKLLIFENFQYDRNLPKFKKRHKHTTVQKNSSIAWKAQASDNHSIAVTAVNEINEAEGNELSKVFEEEALVEDYVYSSSEVGFSNNGRLVINQDASRMSLTERFSKWFRREPKPEITIEQFFKSIKNSTSELVTVQERASGYEAALKSAREAGQRALQEQLQEAILAVKAETQLLTLDKRKYLTEETLVNFTKKATKGLRLDWISNFTRMIPPDVLATKVLMDQRGIFDNYAVLHYDPKGTSRADTLAEKEAKKDPILFGLLNGRRRLYFVGDWIDEFCDLTLDAIADTLGANSIKQIEKEIF